jgi:hypothetical protein
MINKKFVMIAVLAVYAQIDRHRALVDRYGLDLVTY